MPWTATLVSLPSWGRENRAFFAPVYPFTIQNLMYVMLAIGFAELWTRWPVIGISITRKRRKPRRASETA